MSLSKSNKVAKATAIGAALTIAGIAMAPSSVIAAPATTSTSGSTTVTKLTNGKYKVSLDFPTSQKGKLVTIKTSKVVNGKTFYTVLGTVRLGTTGNGTLTLAKKITVGTNLVVASGNTNLYSKPVATLINALPPVPSIPTIPTLPIPSFANGGAAPVIFQYDIAATGATVFNSTYTVWASSFSTAELTNASTALIAKNSTAAVYSTALTASAIVAHLAAVAADNAATSAATVKTAADSTAALTDAAALSTTASTATSTYDSAVAASANSAAISSANAEASTAVANYTAAVAADDAATSAATVKTAADSTALLTDATALLATASTAYSTATLASTAASTATSAYAAASTADSAAASTAVALATARAAVTFTPSATVDSPYTVANFDNREDITITGLTAFVKLADSEVGTVLTKTSLAEALTYVAGLNKDFSVFAFAGDTYVYGDVGVVDQKDATDLLVKFNGLVDLDVLLSKLNS